MQEKRFVLCDPDHVYVERFMEYVGKKANFLFQVYGFTDEAQLEQFLEEEPADLVLIGEALWKGLTDEQRDRVQPMVACLRLLSEERPRGDEGRIFRYQSVEQILTRLLTDYERQLPVSSETDSRTKLAAVWSPVGRCGKTTCALLLGQRLAGYRHEKVLYIDLEEIPGPISLPAEELKFSLSDHLYYRKTEGEGNRILSLTDTMGDLSVIAPAVNPEDLWETSDEELAGWLESVKSQGIYDWVLVDLGRGRNPLPVLSLCERILIPAREDPVSEEKLAAALKYLNRSEEGIGEERYRVRYLPDFEELRDRPIVLHHEGFEEWLEREWDAWEANRSR